MRAPHPNAGRSSRSIKTSKLGRFGACFGACSFRILFWLVHHRAIFADVLCVESKGDVRIIARVCRTMQCVVKWTHNPLVGGSNPSGPTIESTTCGLRQCPGFGACDVIVTYQKRPRCLACGQWIFVHHGAHPFQTRMLVDHGRLRVGMAQGAHDQRQVARCPHDLRSERVAGAIELYCAR